MFMSNYLKFIGFTEKPSVDLQTLTSLHRLHTYKFPFENLTPFLHQEVKLDDQSLEEKFLNSGRGGYCFEQNLFFKRALTEIGFKVTGLGARVLWNQPEDLITRRSHMLLIVEIDAEKYLCDVGFGGLTLTTPLKFKLHEEQKTSHENFRIGTLGNDLKLEALVGGVWKTLYRFDEQVHHLVDYEVPNYYLYTHPTSIFRNNLIAAMPFKGGRFAFNNDTLTIYENGSVKEKKKFGTPEEILNVLADTFKIKIPERSRLADRINELLISLQKKD
jgi:N-hydroxyarylamine O-acetyltransferase